MISLLSVIPLICFALWLFAEFRGLAILRRVSGVATMLTIAIIGFMWGVFAESFRHVQFPIPADAPLPTESVAPKLVPPPPPGPASK